jgi:hypothetical protein
MGSEADNYLYSIMATEHNLEANRQKLMQDKGRGEYLRLMYNSDGNVYGSLCRSLGTFVNGNWESDVNQDGIARSQAIWEQISVLVRRGLKPEMGDALCANCISYFSKVIHRGWITEPINMRYIQTSVVDGGLGLPSYVTGKIYRCKFNFNRVGKERKLCGSKLDIPLNASRDYIKYLNTEILPKDGKIRKDEVDGALDILSASTIGLELPPSKNILNLSKSEVKTINNICKIDANFYEDGHDGENPIDVAPEKLVSGISKAKRLSSNMDYYDKVKQVVSLLVNHTELEKTKILKQLTQNREIIEGFDTKIDRHDKGGLPPDIVGTAKLYSLSKCKSYKDVVIGINSNAKLMQLSY